MASAALPQHEESVGGLDLHVERGARGLGGEPVAFGEHRSASVTANAGEGKPLLDREAHVGALPHERQMVERGGEHWVFERRDHVGAGSGCGRAGTSRLDLEATLMGHADGVA